MSNMLYVEELHGKVLRWGNSYGIRITRAEVERLGLHEGDEVDLLLPDPTAAPELPTFDFGDWNPVDDHDMGWGEPEDP